MSTAHYTQKFDSVPEFWQFFNSLNSDDLIVELIQNELDANARHTQISFELDRLVCRGDGEPVTEDGWERLSYVKGAGDLVPSKRFRIGIKNHGLKACFALGDDIILRSGGQFIQQTLYQNGKQRSPSPAAFDHPLPDEQASATGCLVEVPYRTQFLRVTMGDTVEREPAGPDLVERLFLDACRQLPNRLMGVVSPKIRDHYSLTISHYALGRVKISWRAKRSSNKTTRQGRRFALFGRECAIASSSASVDSGTIYEQVCTFRISSPRDSTSAMPEHFEPNRNSFRAEIAWRVGKKNRPIASEGLRRYPIGYDSNSDEAHTGLGVHFSGPYRSDAQRHSISREDPLNACIDRGCRDALVDTMVSYLVPRHGAKSLELFVASSRPNGAALAQITELAVQKRAIPLQPPQRALRTKPGSRSFKLCPHKIQGPVFGPRQSSRSGKKKIVIPSFDTDRPEFSNTLSEICPVDQDQINKDVPNSVLGCLATDRFDDLIVFFNGEHALQRLQPLQGNVSFPWKNETEWKRSLGDPLIAKQHLDAVHAAIEKGYISPGSLIVFTVHIPDVNGEVQLLADLFSASMVPPSLKSRHLVLLLHPSLLGHALLKRSPWKRDTFTVSDYLDYADFNAAPLEERREFWRWLRENWKGLKSGEKNEIAQLPVWPGTSGDLCCFDSLCEPTSSRVTSILRGAIERPSHEIFSYGLANKSGRGKFAIRKAPTIDEIEDYLLDRLEAFPAERQLDTEGRRDFRAFENELAALVSTPELKGQVVKLGQIHAVALNGDSYLKPPGELVRNEGIVARLALRKRHVIHRAKRSLDQVQSWSPRVNPSARQIEAALREDGANHDAHIPRIREFVNQANKESIPREGIKDVPCIPLSGELYAPSQLAMRGRLDYWRDWKKSLPVGDVSAEVQRLYRAVGVIGGTPTVNESSLFFRWLNTREAEVIADHVDQILRHIVHRSGPLAWSTDHPEIPFIPVENSADEVRLVTRTEATKGIRPVVIPDFESLENQIRQHPRTPPVYLAVVESPRVNEPITAELRNFGLKTLRDLAGEPESVGGFGVNAQASTGQFEQVLKRLNSDTVARQLRKRFDDLGLDKRQKNLKRKWRDRLSAIEDVQVADSVIATYKLSRQTFTVPEVGKFDKGSGTLWLESSSDMQENFYDLIAELIFDDPQKFLGSVLRRAYEMELRYRNPDFLSEEFKRTDQFEMDDEVELDEDHQELVATSGIHPAPVRDPSRNLPKPEPIPARANTSRSLADQRRKPSSRNQPADETEQVENLKVKQYAWHCQACLATAEPVSLAPFGSYVASYQNRRGVMQAHHCDHVNALGARHVGNILLLCQYHHLDIGDAITRKDVIARFDETIDQSITFLSEDGTRQLVHGKRMAISPRQRDSALSLFFTNDHLNFWRERASEDRLI